MSTTFEQFQQKLKSGGYDDLGRTLKGIGRMSWSDAQKNSARELAAKAFGGKAPATQDAPAKGKRAKKGAKPVATPVKKTRTKKADAAPAAEAPKRRGKKAAAPVSPTRIKKKAAKAAPKAPRAARGNKSPKAPKQTRKPTQSAAETADSLSQRIAQSREIVGVYSEAMNSLRASASSPRVAEALDNANNALAELLNSFQPTLVKPFTEQVSEQDLANYRRFIAVAPGAPAAPTNGQSATSEL